MANPRQCQAVNKQGRPCGAPPLVEGGRCFWHDPETAEDAAAARRLGGKRRRREGAITGAYAIKGADPGEELLRVLDVAIVDTLELENSVPRSRALAHLTSVKARVKETTEYEARLQALEAGVRRAPPDADPPTPPAIWVQYPDGRRERQDPDAWRKASDGGA